MVLQHAGYSALPSDVKSYYDKNNALVQSLIDEAINPNATTTGASASGSGSGSATGSAAGTQSTGAAPSSVAKVLGAGVAAAFVGVMAL